MCTQSDFVFLRLKSSSAPTLFAHGLLAYLLIFISFDQRRRVKEMDETRHDKICPQVTDKV